MAESTKQVPGRIVISPDDPRRSRTWPDPAELAELSWSCRYAPEEISRRDMLLLASAVDAYRHIFAMPQREFLPTHAAIRAHLAAKLIASLIEEPADA
jgi:hypothetical protein